MIVKPASCSGCPLYEAPVGKHNGYVPASGEGRGGVLIVAEAAGEWEEREGMPLVGKSGYALFQNLLRVEHNGKPIAREDFLLHNVLSCRPPDNKFDKPYIPLAISKCAPNLDTTIAKIKALAKEAGKHPVIVTLGVPAFKRVMGFDTKLHADLLKKDYYAYPFWSDKYGLWVFNAPHPAYLVRGKTQYWPIVWFVIKRALEVADEGLTLDNPDYLLDPTSWAFEAWAEGYIRSLIAIPDNPLSYDIETPYKKKNSEDEVEKDEDEDISDHIILRISFSYLDTSGKTHTTSVKWSAEFMAGIERLFAIAPFVLGWNSDTYDYPRVSKHVKINGVSLDGMVAWHILQTSLDKGLGFVTPLFWKDTLMWKHLADAQPAYYNAKDADAALRNFVGTKQGLIDGRLWHVYERHWIELYKALKYMTGVGVLRDDKMRAEAETLLSGMMDEIEGKMEEAVPQEARKLKVYKKTPKDTAGLIQVAGIAKVKVCTTCGLEKPKKAHFAPTKQTKPTKKNPAPELKAENPCISGRVDVVERAVSYFAKPLDFKVSKLGMTNYQTALKHQAILTRKERKVTFNADAITLLVKKYPKDPLYPLILEHRKTSKLLSVYIGHHNTEVVDVPDDYTLQLGERWA